MCNLVPLPLIPTAGMGCGCSCGQGTAMSAERRTEALDVCQPWHQFALSTVYVDQRLYDAAWSGDEMGQDGLTELCCISVLEKHWLPPEMKTSCKCPYVNDCPYIGWLKGESFFCQSKSPPEPLLGEQGRGAEGGKAVNSCPTVCPDIRRAAKCSQCIREHAVPTLRWSTESKSAAEP